MRRKHSTAAVIGALFVGAFLYVGHDQVGLDLPDVESLWQADRSSAAPADDGVTAEDQDSPLELPESASEAVDVLHALTVTERPSDNAGYRRDAYGSAWADVDQNGCNQRDDVLKRDAVPGTVVVAQQGSCPHDVLAGTWVDPYTGQTLTFDDLKEQSQAQAIQIDHVVPLAEAHRSGAHEWDDEQRLQFANNLDNLLAVDGPTNASKGDDDPAAWRPRAEYQCAYATRWIAVKDTWDLAVDQPEVDALLDMLTYC